MENFNINAKQIFLTYPQCPLTRQEIQQFIKQKFGNDYESSVICQEEHEPTEDDNNTGLHLHAYVLLKKKKHIRNCRFFDIIKEDTTYHPNVQSVKSKPAVIKYICKSDVEILSDNFDTEAYLESIQTKKGYSFHILAKQVKEGQTARQIWENDESSGFYVNHKRKIDDIIKFNKELANSKPKPKFTGVTINGTNDKSWIKVINWTNVNFLRPRKFKQKQLWIWGADHDIGKTYFFLKILPHYYNMYSWLKGDSQDSTLQDAQYILIDEFCGGITINDLKRLSQMGGDYSTKLRYAGIHTITRNVPLIVTCQKSIQSTYPNCSQEDIEALQCRFIEVNIKSIYYMTPNNIQTTFPDGAPWIETIDDTNISEEFVDPNELIGEINSNDSTSLSITTTNLLIGDDSFDDHSENSNEINKRKKK